MPSIIRDDFYLVVAGDNNSFAIYQQQESESSGFIGSPTLYATITSMGQVWSPPSNMVANATNAAGQCAFSRDGEIYITRCTYGGGIVITDTGINEPEIGSRFYGLSTLLSSDGHQYYKIMASDGKVFHAVDTVTSGAWTEETSSGYPYFMVPPTPTSEIKITQADLDWANTQFPGYVFSFGLPVSLVEGGANEHTGPPFTVRTESGIMEFVNQPTAVSISGGVVDLAALATGTGPGGGSQLSCAGMVDKVGLPVKQEG